MPLLRLCAGCQSRLLLSFLCWLDNSDAAQYVQCAVPMADTCNSCFQMRFPSQNTQNTMSADGALLQTRLGEFTALPKTLISRGSFAADEVNGREGRTRGDRMEREREANGRDGEREWNSALVVMGDRRP